MLNIFSCTKTVIIALYTKLLLHGALHVHHITQNTLNIYKKCLG